MAANNGYVDILEWGASQDPKILPTQLGMNSAVELGHMEILKWGASQTPKILPTV